MRVIRMLHQERDSVLPERRLAVLSTNHGEAFGRDALALFCSIVLLLVEVRLVPESIRTYAEVHQ